MATRTLTVALIGNPNAGKSTLFNALSGLNVQTGNYPGVTVDLAKGKFVVDGTTVELIDLPGTYSLAPRSPDEMVSVDVLLGQRPGIPVPDVIVAVVDASNLDRHLYLTTQLLELNKPVVLAVNMMDVAKKMGVEINLAKLSEEMGVTAVAVQANTRQGVDAVKAAILVASTQTPTPHAPRFPDEVNYEVELLQKQFSVPAFIAQRLLFDVNGYLEQKLLKDKPANTLTDARARLATAGFSVPSIEARTRYGWIRGLVAQTINKPATRPITTTDKLDRVLTHKVWGTLVFLFVMFVLFVSIFSLAKPVMDLLKNAFDSLAKVVEDGMAAGPLRALLADGIIKGAGSVVVFLPQIIILFGFIAILEDCGYMARAAFLMDRVMSRAGLSGKSFIPLLSSVACAIPGIMAARVIENRRDRIATMVIAPLMSCSARLPVYSLMIGAFITFPGQAVHTWKISLIQGAVLFAMYMIGFIVAPIVALILKRTALKGETPTFVMELPAYKRPQIKLVFRRMLGAGWSFLKRAGTFILASMILIWALSYFPRLSTDGTVKYDEKVIQQEEAKDEDGVKATKKEWQENSYLGQMGKALEPIVRPLGWDWKIGVATLASFPAREVIVGTLGILYEQGDVEEVDAKKELGNAIKADVEKDPVRGKYAVPVALSVMVFFALCCQCVSTLVVIKRESKSWTWPVATFVYMTVLAYLGALVTYQLGKIVVDMV